MIRNIKRIILASANLSIYRYIKDEARVTSTNLLFQH